MTVHVDALDTLRRRCSEIQAGLDTGNTSFQAEKDEILALILDRQADSLNFATLNKDADSLTAVFNEVKATINSGLIQVDQIEILGTSFTETYQDIDSATSWRIPLSFDGSFNQYEVMISDLTEIIELDYDVVQEIDEERNVLIRAQNIRIIEKMYVEIDSVQSNCEENCIDGETVFTFYF